jgi:hypothetical protein
MLLTFSVRADVINVHSDATWRTFDTLPPSGWNTDLAFDDSDAAGWQNAFKSPSGDNIWFGSNLSSQGPNQAWFRHIFTLNDVVSDAAGNFFFDDNGELYINGHLIINDTGGGSTSFPDVQVDPSFFDVGQNLIAVHGIDTHAPFNNIGVNMTVNTLPEPSNLLFTSLAVLLLFRK